jgi:hypothetical protein
VEEGEKMLGMAGAASGAFDAAIIITVCLPDLVR